MCAPERLGGGQKSSTSTCMHGLCFRIKIWPCATHHSLSLITHQSSVFASVARREDKKNKKKAFADSARLRRTLLPTTTRHFFFHGLPLFFSIRLTALMDLYIHPLYVLVSKILSSVLNSPAPIHPLYHPLSTLSTVGPTCHFI
jgi:hypothetical protein